MFLFSVTYRYFHEPKGQVKGKDCHYYLRPVSGNVFSLQTGAKRILFSREKYIKLKYAKCAIMHFKFLLSFSYAEISICGMCFQYSVLLLPPEDLIENKYENFMF